MSTTYLIDGYNLIHVLGFLTGTGPKVLERSRLRLLQFLVEQRDAASHTIVVFDAAHAPPRARPLHQFQGIEVRFALEHDEADDLIELLIRDHPAPRTNLVIVSSDQRLLHAARRADAAGWSCAEFLDHLEARHRPMPLAAPPSEKAERLSQQETERWLQEFGYLADDPGFKELFDPYPFDSE